MARAPSARLARFSRAERSGREKIGRRKVGTEAEDTLTAGAQMFAGDPGSEAKGING